MLSEHHSTYDIVSSCNLDLDYPIFSHNYSKHVHEIRNTGGYCINRQFVTDGAIAACYSRGRYVAAFILLTAVPAPYLFCIIFIVQTFIIPISIKIDGLIPFEYCRLVFINQNILNMCLHIYYIFKINISFADERNALRCATNHSVSKKKRFFLLPG